MAAVTALCEALNQGISSGSLIDTKILLYSRRDPSGRIYQQKALYANSHVLKKVPYFKGLLFGNFSESQTKDFKEEVDEEESAKNYGYLSDSDLEEDEDDRPSFKYTGKSKGHSFDPFPAPGGENVVYEKNDEHVGKGKVVIIPDMAFITFQAFLMYLYTDAIDFAPFGSEENRRSRSVEIVDPCDSNVPRPSPKSIYRLADKYDVSALKTLALDRLRYEQGKFDIVEESFSRFASSYKEIRDVYVEQLAHVWVTDSSQAIRSNAKENIRSSVEERIDSFAEGNLEHGSEMLSALWRIANKDGEIEAPSNPSSNPIQVTSPAHWNSVKTALIKSIRTGVFFDRKYWARHFKTGDILKPVYFSSTIMDDKSRQFSKLVKYLKGGDTAVSDLEGETNIESDCEEASSEVKKGTPKEKDEEDVGTRAVLITGSFSAWKSLFFYRCTDSVSFAPLKSQGIDSRSEYIRGKTVATVPPPCSPKSIYVLASLLEIQPLCDRAFGDIKSKMSQDNVVSEVFSWVTAIQDRIMEMECELLISSFKNPHTIDLMTESIGRIADGSSSHSANALKLGLKKAFHLKIPPPGVKLRCSWTSCTSYNNHISISSIGTNVYCQACSNRYSHHLQCVDCGNNRTGNYTSCQHCKKKFA